MGAPIDWRTLLGALDCLQPQRGAASTTTKTLHAHIPSWRNCEAGVLPDGLAGEAERHRESEAR
jgi:hypothetical protein